MGRFIICVRNQILIGPRKVRWAVHTARMGEMRDAYKILFGKLEGKRSVGKS
jgi:hypothetical protein